MSIKIVDTELKVMEVVWLNNGASAADIAKQMLVENGWKKNTTYTLISRLIEKGALERQEPNFFCRPLVSKDDVVRGEVKTLIDKICGGSKRAFFSAFLDDPTVTEAEIEDLKAIVNRRK